MVKKIELKFINNKKNDTEEFFRLWHGHENLRPELIDFVKKNSEDTVFADVSPVKSVVASAINHKYAVDEKEISDGLKKVEGEWEKTEPLFYELVGKIFKKDFTIDKGFDVYVSVLPFFVRNLEDGRISVPYGTKNVNEPVFVLTHELLHVIFYSYIYCNYEELREDISSKKVWDFSEAINVVIQGQKEWVDVFKVEPSFYPEHRELFLALNDHWKAGNGIDALIKDFLF